MTELPDRPFITKDFSPRGGGIDFLGLRWVNLAIVGRDLIPELNNVTTDMGTFFLAGWIPWKFRQLCRSEEDYTERNYKAFREKAEVALSLTLQDESGIERDHGLVRNRVGITQSCALPVKLSFKGAKRTDQNNLYAAAIYGPSLRALGLIDAYRSQAQEGKEPLSIAIAGGNPDAVQIVTAVDDSLKKAKSYQLLASLDSPVFRWEDIRKLGEAGLDPARYRNTEYSPVKACFRRRLLPKNPNDLGYPRTVTTRLMLATLRQRDRLSAWEMRTAWYTGMLNDGKPLRFKEGQLVEQRQRWSCFLARQYQRYAIELFLWCFERALKEGNRSVEEIIEYWAKRSKTAEAPIDGTFRDVLNDCAGSLLRNDDLATSEAWNNKIHGGDERFEHVEEPRDDKAVIHGLRMLAGWHWRMLVRQQDERTKDLMSLGGADRMSMTWFLQWLRERQSRPIRDLLKDIFSDLVFAQHMRIALARFDGTAQRLRFLLGDTGIEPTVSARADLGELRLPWMPDRLDTLIALLCDCDVLAMRDDTLRLGPKAGEIS